MRAHPGRCDAEALQLWVVIVAHAMSQPVPHALVLRGVARLLQWDLRMADSRPKEALIIVEGRPNCRRGSSRTATAMLAKRSSVLSTHGQRDVLLLLHGKHVIESEQLGPAPAHHHSRRLFQSTASTPLPAPRSSPEAVPATYRR